VRSRRQVFTLNTAAGEVDVVLGVNGYIFISKHTTPAASATEISITRLDEGVSETLYSSQNDAMEPAVMREITRVSTLIKGLVSCGMRVDEDMIVKVYEGAVELDAEERSMAGASVGIDKGIGAKGLVEAVLGRLAVEAGG
jgi:exosome complex component RRP4